tara:strand:- start:769 stop:1044 length:276 start_codon:yes stop_codon:yes gene_type:complete
MPLQKTEIFIDSVYDLLHNEVNASKNQKFEIDMAIDTHINDDIFKTYIKYNRKTIDLFVKWIHPDTPLGSVDVKGEPLVHTVTRKWRLRKK